MDWDVECLYEPDEECEAVEKQMDELAGSLVNLAKIGEPVTSSQASFGADFVRGTSVGAIAALGVIYVMHKCRSKAQDSGAFHGI